MSISNREDKVYFKTEQYTKVKDIRQQNSALVNNENVT